MTVSRAKGKLDIVTEAYLDGIQISRNMEVDGYAALTLTVKDVPNAENYHIRFADLECDLKPGGTVTVSAVPGSEFYVYITAEAKDWVSSRTYWYIKAVQPRHSAEFSMTADPAEAFRNAMVTFTADTVCDETPMIFWHRVGNKNISGKSSMVRVNGRWVYKISEYSGEYTFWAVNGDGSSSPVTVSWNNEQPEPIYADAITDVCINGIPVTDGMEVIAGAKLQITINRVTDADHYYLYADDGRGEMICLDRIWSESSSTFEPILLPAGITRFFISALRNDHELTRTQDYTLNVTAAMPNLNLTVDQDTVYAGESISITNNGSHTVYLLSRQEEGEFSGYHTIYAGNTCSISRDSSGSRIFYPCDDYDRLGEPITLNWISRGILPVPTVTVNGIPAEGNTVTLNGERGNVTLHAECENAT